MDILGLDVTWAPEFAEAGWIQEWTGDAYAEVGYFGPGPWWVPGLWRLAGPRWRRRAEVVTFAPYRPVRPSVAGS